MSSETSLTAEEESLLGRLDANPPPRVRNAIEQRITEITTDPDGLGAALPVDGDGRVWCSGCRRSVFPEFWSAHLLGVGEHQPVATLDPWSSLRRVEDGDPFNAGWNAALTVVGKAVEKAVGPKQRIESGMTGRQLIALNARNDLRDTILRRLAPARKGA